MPRTTRAQAEASMAARREQAAEMAHFESQIMAIADEIEAEEHAVTKRFDVVINKGETAEDAFDEMIGEFNVSLRIVTMSGPAGGNPVAEVSGAPDEVNGFLERHGYPIY